MAYTTFTAGTVAVASEVNANFDIATNSTGGLGIHPSGRWFAAEGYGRSVQTAGSATLNRLYLLPFHVLRDGSYTQLSVMGGTIGASMNCRLGIYNNDSTTGLPSTLVLDAGAAGAMASATSQYLTSAFTQNLAAGTYWLACAVQTANDAAYVAVGTPSASVGGRSYMGYPSGYSAVLPNAYLRATASVSGALPSTLVSGVSFDSGTAGPLVFIKKG
jgi:hypothetical protein